MLLNNMGFRISSIVFNTFPAAERFILARKPSSGNELQQVEDEDVRSVAVDFDNSRIIYAKISYDGGFVIPKFHYARLEVIV